MNGLTIIHLSDLHVGWKSPSQNQAPDHLAQLTAASLAADFRCLMEEHRIPFRTEETLLVVTGDITHACVWPQFHLAASFFSKLRQEFAKALPGNELLPEHIICIPGNHDIEVPQHDPKKKTAHLAVEQTKYRNFKLFIDEVTQYADYAKEFRLDAPRVRVTIPTPFPVQLIDLNSCHAIACYGKTAAGTTPLDGEPRLSRQALDEMARRFLPNDTPSPRQFRIALMHHHPSDLRGDAAGWSDALTGEATLQWLVAHHFALLLTGHTHSPGGESTDPIDESRTLYRLSTGHSFLQGDRLDEGNSYQVIRIEPRAGVVSRVFRRSFAWRARSPSPQNRWDAEKPNGMRPLERLERNGAGKDVRSFLGVQDDENWVVIAHCASGKFENYGVQSPGETINASFVRTFKRKGRFDRTSESDTTQWDRYEGIHTVFLVDSPWYNLYVRWILDNYGTYLAGASIAFEDLRETSDTTIQTIKVAGSVTPLKSSKTEDEPFGPYVDYLLIMRLPGLGPWLGKTNSEVPECDRKRVMWIVAGIHSKASYAGAKLFESDKLQLFVSSISKQCQGDVPDYFEVVYRIPENPGYTTELHDFAFLKEEPVHFRSLRPKRDVAMADELPPRISVRFLRQDHWNEIPIDVVHFDPVAGCNYNCSTCIEDELKRNRIIVSYAAYSRVLFDVKEAGCQHLNFYGGEPTLHPEFPDLVRLARHLGFEMLLVTNGSKLSESHIANAIIEAKQRFRIRVSIDSTNAESHASVHGLSHGVNTYEAVRESVKRLIESGVSVTVSMLLHPEILGDLEAACNDWKKCGATAVILRPVATRSATPSVTTYKPEPVVYTTRQLDLLMRLIRRPDGFVLCADWFADWIAGSVADSNASQHSVIYTPEKKEYECCYSGYYRIVISPFLPAGARSERVIIDDEEWQVTNDTWISLCSYRRYVSGYGERYPDNLPTWLNTKRHEMLSKIHPTDHCRDIVCCRDPFNRQIRQLLG